MWLIGLAIFTAVMAYSEAYRDMVLIKKDFFIDHPERLIRRSFFVLVISFLATVIYNEPIIQWIWYFGFFLGIFYLVFPHALNLLRGLPFFYLGSDDNAAKWDLLWKKFPAGEFVLKLFVTVFSLIKIM